jgi:DNA mismatch repair ATPase MutS
MSTAPAVALYLSRSPSNPVSDPFCSHSLQCSVWVKPHHFYSFVDDPHAPTLLTKLMARIQPSVVYVASEKSASVTAGQVVTKLNLQEDDLRFIETLEAKKTLDEVHKRLSRNLSLSRRVSTDPTLSSTPMRLALGLYFQQIQQDEDMTEMISGKLLQDAYLALDETAAATLFLWPEQSGEDATKKDSSSLYGILSQPIQTIMGQRRLAHLLRQPLVDLNVIQERQDAVAALVQAAVGRDSVREGLRFNIDVDKLADKLSTYAQDETTPGIPKGTARQALQALYHLYLVAAQRLPTLCERLETANVVAESGNTLLNELYQGLQKATNELHRAGELAEAVLDLDQAPTEYLVRSSYSDELQDVANEIAQLQSQVEECHADMNQAWAQASGVNNAVRLETLSDKEWQFRKCTIRSKS